MATGITRTEQLSDDARAATRIDLDNPLPHRKESAHLTYKGKLSLSQVLQTDPANLFSVAGTNASRVSQIPNNSFVLCDNLHGLAALQAQSEKATLMYMDPPYGTGMGFQSRDLQHAYNDDFGEAEYIEMLRRRLILARECLDETGSIYVHIGHQMVGHLKVLLDEVFGSENFRNLITRRKCSSKNFTRNSFSNLNDFVLFYSKSRNYIWNNPGRVPERDWVEKEYPKTDSLGRKFKLVPIHAPGTRNGETGQPWRGKMPPRGKHWQYSPRKLEELDRIGDIHWSSTGNPRRKVYFTNEKKLGYTDYWDCFKDAHHQSIKVTGYPTEKNLDMLKMIVEASSNAGDLVVDPFCGSGTTIDAARSLGRRFIGMDASYTAAETVVKRLTNGLEPIGDYVNEKAATPKAANDLFDPKLNLSLLVQEEFLLEERELVEKWSSCIASQT
ncbi:site-specific DNA-methyltransferase [Erythrobacter sp. YJ-T3-07]|uniref:site-specific DNA-methyltransferase n=1 Tax=Erythrobacter sp. YJ-T3-07 TaxID=2793063 RepID=UPI0018D4B614|nr:site-specific DNA-methyltransferase [Erythrobacter sp. YJ-T3-07]MBH1943734.1 site-specific DNA-methyltransferase [Erythrobacter sp. YJ-T3-07]